MFTVVFKNILEQNVQISWHIQNDKPGVPDTVCKLIADGNELELILLKFENIPFCQSEKMTWNGEMAQFIYDNLE